MAQTDRIRKILLDLMATAIVAAGTIAAEAQSGAAVSLDRVVAVVNNHPILASDISEELRFSVLDPESAPNGTALTPQVALQQLISRTLIQQQMRQDDTNVSKPSSEEVRTRILEMRRDVPACTRADCASEPGWNAFLSSKGLTYQQVEQYVHMRMEILRFIEVRFRQGIRIAEEDTEAYYREKLLPHYVNSAQAPPLKEVAPRIEEILLQEQVNALFGSWLDNLRAQGDVEVLDSSLESRHDTAAKGSGQQ